MCRYSGGYRQFRRARDNNAVHEVAVVAAHAAEARLVLAQDVQITATLSQHLPALNDSVRPLDSAVVRLDAMLLIKVEGRGE